VPPFFRLFDRKVATSNHFLKGFPTMAKLIGEHIAKENAASLSKSAQAAEKIVKGNAEALAESDNASRAPVQELTQAYQELATKNARNLTAAMQAFAAVKSPAEFLELQQRLIKEGVQAAVSDSRHIAQLTAALFTAAFEPVKKQIESAHKSAPT
jgi:phasin family protein